MATTKATGSVIADNSITLAKMSHGTDGNVITYSATGAPAFVATGSSGDVLTSGGAGVAPTFQAAGGGAWAFLSLVEASAASTVDIETTFDDTYHAYVVVATDVFGIGSGLGDITCQLKIGGSYRTSGNYGHVSLLRYNSTAHYAKLSGAAGAITIMDMPTSGTWPSHWVMTTHGDPTITGARKSVSWQGHSGNSYYGLVGGGSVDTSGALTGIRYEVVSGTLTGKFRLYGISKS